MKYLQVLNLNFRQMIKKAFYYFKQVALIYGLGKLQVAHVHGEKQILELKVKIKSVLVV